MGFFAEFNAWLTALLAGYIGDHVSRIAAALEPAIVTLGIVYVMVWGYLELTGQIEEPFIDGVKRILTLALILGCALQLWLYHSLLVDTFFNAPSQLGAVIVGAFDPVGIVDQIIFQGGDAANLLLEKGIPSMARRSAGFDVPDFLASGPRDILVPVSAVDMARDVLGDVGIQISEPAAPAPETGVPVGMRIAVAVLCGGGFAALVAWLLVRAAG